MEIPDNEQESFVKELKKTGFNPKDISAIFEREEYLRKNQIVWHIVGEISPYKYNKPPDIKKRIKELVKVSKELSANDLSPDKKKELEISLKWNKGIVEQEINHGEKLNKFLLHEITYDEFIDEIKPKNKKNHISLKLAKEDSEKITPIPFLRQKQLEQMLLVDTKRRIKKIPDTAKNALKILNTLTDIPIEMKLSPYIASREHQVGTNKTIYLKENSHTDVVMHEIGHQIEQSTEILKENISYINSRVEKYADGTTRYNSSLEGYTKEEAQTIPLSNFPEDYTGKIYLKNNEPHSTELISMGLQNFEKYSLRHFADTDRDHLLYTLYFLNEINKHD
jgi:hypothetical protein